MLEDSTDCKQLMPPSVALVFKSAGLYAHISLYSFFIPLYFLFYNFVRCFCFASQCWAWSWYSVF